MGDGGEYGGETDERERDSYESKEHYEEEHEREVRDLLDELEREMDESKEEADELAKDLEREMEDDEKAREIANELEKEMEEGSPKELDDDFEKELGHDLDEVRDDLHDDFVNDMEHQLDDASTKEATTDEFTENNTGTSSEMTESSESYGDAGGGMAYAMETKGSSEGETQTEVEGETEGDLEKEFQESTEQEGSGESNEESEQEKFTNKIERREDTEQESESEPATEGSVDKEGSEKTRQSEDYSEEASNEEAESQESSTSRAQKELDEEVSEPDVEESDSETAEPECAEHHSEPEAEAQEFENDVERSEVSETTDESPKQENEPTSEVEREISESESTDAESDELAKSESESSKLDEFVERVKEILDEKPELDDNYDYVQDPLTGEMQRVPKILAEYETEEQKQRRKLRNLFAELSEEERERFKELVRENAESEEERSAEEVEKQWTRIVEEAERCREGIDIQEVHRLYFDQGLSMLEVGRKLGFKSLRPIQRVFKEQGWEARPFDTRRKSEDYKEMHRLYFEDGYTLKEIAHKYSMHRHTIGKIFREQGWITRRTAAIKRGESISKQTPTRMSESRLEKSRPTPKQAKAKSGKSKSKRRRTKRSIGPAEVYKLYFDDGLTMMDISKKLGFKSAYPISQLFKERGWKPLTQSARKKKKDFDVLDVFRLYYIEGLIKEDVASELGIPESRLRKVFKEMRWPTKIRQFKTQEERVLAKKEGAKKTSQRIKDLREKKFGTECRLCGETRKLAIHKKDGVEHERDILWRIKFLNSVNTDDWAALCIPCHRGVHWLMETKGYNWTDLENLVRSKKLSGPKNLEPLALPPDTASSSSRYLELRSKYQGDALRNAYFGDTCYFCGEKSEERRIPLHRKDGRLHPEKLTKRERYFRTLNPDEWVPLCGKHHRHVHWAMDKLNLEWDDLKTVTRD